MNTVVPAWGRRTIYRGVQMRSRLEARVAAKYDADGESWVYEPMCFADATGQYLPDFELLQPDGGRVFVEVKPPLSSSSLAQVKERMSIIRSSLPDAWLVILEAISGGTAWVHMGSPLRWYDRYAMWELP